MTTLEELKKIGWAEVEREQARLEKKKQEYQMMNNNLLGHQIQEIGEIIGRIQGMVWILNHIK